MTDHYVAGVYRWWHLSAPSAELLTAESAGALGAPVLAIDLGCGLGTEIGYLTGRGWRGPRAGSRARRDTGAPG